MIGPFGFGSEAALREHIAAEFVAALTTTELRDFLAKARPELPAEPHLRAVSAERRPQKEKTMSTKPTQPKSSARMIAEAELRKQAAENSVKALTEAAATPAGGAGVALSASEEANYRALFGTPPPPALSASEEANYRALFDRSGDVR